jgi:hypothetical protein
LTGFLLNWYDEGGKDWAITHQQRLRAAALQLLGCIEFLSGHIGHRAFECVLLHDVALFPAEGPEIATNID